MGIATLLDTPYYQKFLHHAILELAGLTVDELELVRENINMESLS